MARAFVKASSQAVNLGNPAVLQITGDISISVWFTRGSDSGATYQLFSKDKDTGGRAYTCDLTGNTPRFYINGGAGGGGGNIITGGSAITHDTGWWHYLGTYDHAAQGLGLYINGVSDAANTAPNASASIPTATANVCIGKREYASFNDFFDGTIGEAAVWTAVLTANEAKALSLGVHPTRIRPGSLVGYWPLFGLQSPEPDLSGQGNSGTLENAPAIANHAPVVPFSSRYWNATPLIQTGGVVARQQSLMLLGCGA